MPLGKRLSTCRNSPGMGKEEGLAHLTHSCESPHTSCSGFLSSSVSQRGLPFCPASVFCFFFPFPIEASLFVNEFRMISN